MDTVRRSMDVARNITISLKRIRRSFIRRAWRPVMGGNKERTPRERLEDLERVSAVATIGILLGILVEVGVLLSFHHSGVSWTETLLLIMGNLFIGLGLAVEYFAIMGTITATREDDRETDERLEAAKTIAAQAIERAAVLEKEAADARERTATIEKLTAWRRVRPEQSRLIIGAIRDKAPEIDFLVEYERGNPEAFAYAREITLSIEAAGVKKIRVDANSYFAPGVFGLRTAAAPDTDISTIIEAFAVAGMELVVDNMDLSRHLPLNLQAPNWYLFVAPKPPPSFALPTPSDGD